MQGQLPFSWINPLAACTEKNRSILEVRNNSLVCESRVAWKKESKHFTATHQTSTHTDRGLAVPTEGYLKASAITSLVLIFRIHLPTT